MPGNSAAITRRLPTGEILAGSTVRRAVGSCGCGAEQVKNLCAAVAWLRERLAVEAKNQLKPLVSLTMIELEFKGEDREPLNVLRTEKLPPALASRIRPEFEWSPALTMNNTIRWGILGTGKIARQFAAGLQHLPDARLLAIGSRTAAAAHAFGEQFAVPHRHASYDALVQDADVDVIYVATPHGCHGENTLLALAAGKPVLCEKPFTINAREAEQVIALARGKKLFLMEAMWTRCFPLMEKLRALVAMRAIGEIRMLTADFGFRAEYHEEARLFDLAAGGGALLDVGVYPVSLASMIFGPPTQMVSQAQLGRTGVDEEVAIILTHAHGELALLSAAIRLESPQEAILLGTTGRIRLHAPWWRPVALTLTREGVNDERITFPLTGNGYQYEAAEVMNCLRAGQLESHLMPLDETLAIMKTLDALRAQWGLKYPIE